MLTPDRHHYDNASTMEAAMTELEAEVHLTKCQIDQMWKEDFGRPREDHEDVLCVKKYLTFLAVCGINVPSEVLCAIERLVLNLHPDARR
jgi:hypothetical protein